MPLGGLYVVLNTYQLLKITVNIAVYFKNTNTLNLIKLYGVNITDSLTEMRNGKTGRLKFFRHKS